MNKEWVLHNLAEAADHLRSAIEKVESDNLAGFEAWMPFVYRKLNAAWNWHDVEPEIIRDRFEWGYEEACLFPLDLEDEVSDAKRTSSGG